MGEWTLSKVAMKLTVLLHDGKELDDDLGRRADKDLALALALSVDNAVKSVVLAFGKVQNDGGQVSHSYPPFSACAVEVENAGYLRERKCEPWWAVM